MINVTTSAATGRYRASTTSFVDRSSLPADYFIYPASAQGGFGGINGNDANNGTSRTTPWATFAHANAVIGPGSTVAVAPGNYPQPAQLELTTVGTSPFPVIYRSDRLSTVFGGLGAARLFPNNTTFPTNGLLVNIGSIVSGAGAYITFDGFEVDGLGQTQIASGHNVQCAVALTAANSTVRSCYVHDPCISAIGGTGTVGISVNGSDYATANKTVEGCFVFRIFGPPPFYGPGLNSECIGIYPTGLGSVIRNNVVLGVAGQCVGTFHGSDVTTVANNTLLWGGAGFIIYSSTVSGTQYNLGKCTNYKGFNNICAHMSLYGIETYGEGNIANIAGYGISNNLCFSNSGYGDFYDADAVGTVNSNMFTSNSPVNFVNDAALTAYPTGPAGDFHLASTSVAAYHNGLSTYSGRTPPTIDILGLTRGVWDIGAYKF